MINNPSPTPKPPTTKWVYHGLVVTAFTKSEARALLKKRLGDLPARSKVYKVKDKL